LLARRCTLLSPATVVDLRSSPFSVARAPVGRYDPNAPGTFYEHGPAWE
jgi:hypothetical protein